MRGLLSLMLAIPLAVGCGDGDKPGDAESFEGSEPGDCTDLADNDMDGLFDCDDDGCSGSPECADEDGDHGTTDADDGGTEDGEGLILMYECDSAYADCPDTRRSRYGFLGFLAGGVIVAKTAMFKSVMPSTGAAEQSALAKCTLHTLIARQYLEDFGFPQWDPTPIGEDNNAALMNSRNPVKSKMQKHLDVYHHITRENQMEFKTINV